MATSNVLAVPSVLQLPVLFLRSEGTADASAAGATATQV